MTFFLTCLHLTMNNMTGFMAFLHNQNTFKFVTPQNGFVLDLKTTKNIHPQTMRLSESHIDSSLLEDNQ